ncbi:MAG: glycosyltransferase family 2 protein [Ilumatobacteraceae bacterium]
MSDSQSVDVGVVIVTFNSSDHLDGLLRTLETSLQSVSHRVVAVDNLSTDASVARLRAAGIEVIEMGCNAGYAAGINVGLRRMSDARAVLVLNPDIEMAPNCVETMLGVLQDERVGIVIPQTRDLEGNLSSSQRRDPSFWRALGAAVFGGSHVSRWPRLSEFVADENAYLHPVDVDWGVGAVMLISRACLDQVGEWDESFFLYSEETDYCQRARRAGFRVRYEPSAIVRHEGGGGVSQPTLRSMMVVNKVRLYRRQHGVVPSVGFWLAEILNESTRALAGNKAARAAVTALLLPSRRPPEIKCSASLLPR